MAVQVEHVGPVTVSPEGNAAFGKGLYVAENRGYPTGSTNGEPLGRIAQFTDTRRNGDWDKRTDYATGLTAEDGWDSRRR